MRGGKSAARGVRETVFGSGLRSTRGGGGMGGRYPRKFIELFVYMYMFHSKMG